MNDPGKHAALADLTLQDRASERLGTRPQDGMGEAGGRLVEPAAETASARAAGRTDSQLVPIDTTVKKAWQEQVDYFKGIGQFREKYEVTDFVAPGFDAIIADELSKLPKH